LILWFAHLLSPPKEFVLREAIDDQLKEAYEELKSVPIDGEAGQPILEFGKLYERFKIGEDFNFSATVALQSSFKSELAAARSEVNANSETASEISADA
jgi:hypothetical protein